MRATPVFRQQTYSSAVDPRYYQLPSAAFRAAPAPNHPLAPRTYNSPQTFDDILQPHRIPGIGFDSAARYPWPKCTSGTRASLLSQLSTWLQSSQRDSRILWLFGPAGAGKTAVAQTLAEQCREIDYGRQFGAALFFTDRVRKDDIIPTLVYQLAENCSPYKQYIERILLNDPTVIESSVPVLFKRFIIDPFAALQEDGQMEPKAPLLIILDGMEKCFEEDDVRLVIEQICKQIELTQDNPLVWMVSGRPDSYLKQAFDRFTSQSRITLMKQEVSFGDASSKADVLLHLNHRLREIRDAYQETFDYSGPKSWPSSSQVHTLSDFTSGSFPIANSILGFIEDPNAGDPENQFSEVMADIKANKIPCRGTDLFHNVDTLYAHLLSEVPNRVLPHTLQILGLLVYYPRHPLSCRELCNFLRLGRTSFFIALYKLHSVVKVPYPSETGTSEGIYLYHSSFADYLRDPVQSGAFYIPEPKVHSNIAIHSIYWINLVTRYNCPVMSGTCCQRPQLNLSWDYNDDHSRHQALKSIENFSLKLCWKACLQAEQDDSPAILDELNQLKVCRTSQRPRQNVQTMLNMASSICKWRVTSDNPAGTLDGNQITGDEVSGPTFWQDVIVAVLLYTFIAMQWLMC